MPLQFAVPNESDLESFWRLRDRDLRRVARKARDITIEDVRQEVWLVAAELSDERGAAPDLLNETDQKEILDRLYGKLVLYTEKQMRYALRIDNGWDGDEDTGPSLADVLAAALENEPDARLEQEELAAAHWKAMRRSYSEAVAYVLLLFRFGWDLVRLAEALQIVVATLRSRMLKAKRRLESQPSLFDGICAIEEDFEPTVARRVAAPLAADWDGEQACWAF